MRMIVLRNTINREMELYIKEEKLIEESNVLLLSLLRKTEEKAGKKTILGECVIRFTDKTEITIKDNGELFKPDIEDERLRYNLLMSRNNNIIRIA